MAQPRKKSPFRGKVSEDAQKQGKAGASYGYLNLSKGISVFTPEPGGRVTLDFLPYNVTDPKHPDRNDENDTALPGSLWYKHPFIIHRNVGGANGNSEVCLATVGKKCPICEYRALRSKAGADKDELATMNQSRRNLYIVVPIDVKGFEEKPHIFDISYAMFGKLLKEELEEEPSNDIFPDLDEGKTLTIRFSSETIGNSKPFAEAKKITFADRDPYKESILEEVPNLDEVLNILSYEELKNKWFETEGEVDGGKLKEPKEKASKEEKQLEWADLKTIDRKNLLKMIEGYNLSLNSDDFEDTDEGDVDLRKAIAEEMEIVIPSERSTRRAAPAKEEPVRRGRSEEGNRTSRADKDEADVIDTRSRRSASAKEEPVKRGRASAKSDNECPHDHTFGKDTEKYKDCDDCALFDACLDAKEAR